MSELVINKTLEIDDLTISPLKPNSTVLICMSGFTTNSYQYINQKDAIQIINHLKKQFGL